MTLKLGKIVTNISRSSCVNDPSIFGK